MRLNAFAKIWVFSSDKLKVKWAEVGKNVVITRYIPLTQQGDDARVACMPNMLLQPFCKHKSLIIIVPH